MRSSSGGCVAHSWLTDRLPSPKSMWLICFSLCASRSTDPVGTPAIFFSAPARPGRLPGELHGGRVGEPLALPRHGGLDQAGEELPDEAEHERARCRRPARQRRLPLLLRAAAAAEREDPQPDQAEQQEPVEQADQPHVQPHVAVEDVAELVPDHALQLVAVELVQRAAR